MDFTDILKQVLGGGGLFSSPEEEERKRLAAQAQAVPLAGALPVEEEKPSRGIFGGLMPDDPMKREAVGNGLVNAGAAMMVAGGPSRDPTNFLSVLGSGIGTGAQAYQNYRKDGVEIGNSKAKADALKKGQELSASLGAGIGEVGPMGLSVDDLMKVWRYQVETGDEAGARDTLGMIQQLQQTGAKSGMVVGEDGAFRTADGYNDSLSSTEEAKAHGRKAGEKPFETTDDLKELDRINAERAAAGMEPLSTEEFLAAANKAKGTNINIGENSKKFAEKADEEAAKRYSDIATAGAGANQMVGDMDLLLDLGRKAKTGKGAEWIAALGPYAEAVGANVEGLNEIQAYQAVVSRIAPNLRPVGSGATSDFDAKQFLLSIPSIGNTSEGNELIAVTMQAVAQNKMAGAEIANRVFKGEITWQEGDAEMAKLPNPYERFKEFQKTKRDKPKVLGVDTADTASTDETPKDAPVSLPTVNTEAERNALEPGTIYIGSDGKKRRKR